MGISLPAEADRAMEKMMASPKATDVSGEAYENSAGGGLFLTSTFWTANVAWKSSGV